MEPEPERLVVVPAVAGGALTLISNDRQRDDVEGLLDELLGEDTTDGPGITDVLLFVAGLATVVWGLSASNSLLVGVGVIAAILGVILPLRSLGRRVRARRTRDSIERARSSAGVLAIDAPENSRLAAQYERVLAATEPADGAARLAALTALQEVASLLGGRHPSGAAEAEYVRSRADALSRLADFLDARPPERDAHAMIEARNELDLIAGTGSLTQIDEVVREHKHE